MDEQFQKEKRKEWINRCKALTWNKPVKRLLYASFLLNLIAEIGNQRSFTRLIEYILGNPFVFLYNTLLIMIPLSFSFLFKRRDFVHVLIFVAGLILAVTNGVMLSCRVTPFNATDFRLIKFGLAMIPKYLDWWMILLALMFLIGLIVMLVICFIRMPKRQLPLKRYKLIVMWLVFLFIGSMATQLGTMTGLLSTQFPNLQQAYREYGMPYCFMCSMFNTGISRPNDYNPEAVDDIINEISSDKETEAESGTQENSAENDQPDTKTGQPNIIFVQLESFFDITGMKDLTFNRDPIPNFHLLMKQYSSGYVSVPAVGAGTANTEFEMITGLNLDFFGPGEYPYKTILQKSTCESMAYVLDAVGYQSHACHNNNATFYDRNLVFSNLGFDDFTSIEYMNNVEHTPTGWAKDHVLVSEIEDILDSTEERDYIYTISVQGHGKYPSEPVIENPVITISGIEEEEQYNQYTYYVNQLYEMDRFVAELFQSLCRRDEEFILVMYGDHLPTLGIEDEMLKETDIFQTPYFIASNMDLPKTDRNLEAYQMGSWILNLAGVHEGVIPKLHQAYMDLDMEAEADLDKVLEAEAIYKETGSEVVTNRDVYLYYMKMLAYDMLYGDQTATNGGVLYPPSELQLGVKEISVKMMTASAGGTLYIAGENFTPSSVIFDGDSPMVTEYQSPWLLTADISDRAVGDRLNVRVVQFSESDQFELSSTPSYPILVTKRERRILVEPQKEDPFYQSGTERDTEPKKE